MDPGSASIRSAARDDISSQLIISQANQLPNHRPLAALAWIGIWPASSRCGWQDPARMLQSLLRTVLKIVVASLIVGTVLAHFGITTDTVMQVVGLSQQRLAELAERGLHWALPNLLLGMLVIVPMWLVAYIFRPPGTRSG
jgi:hypothetical protein